MLLLLQLYILVAKQRVYINDDGDSILETYSNLDKATYGSPADT